VSWLGDYFRDLREKMVKDPLPSSRVAAGWSLGMFIGCAVPFGLQLLISIPLSVLWRVSKVGATLGTLITNPVTIFFIYPAQTYFVNRYLLGGSLSFERLKTVEWSYSSVKALGAEAMVSYLLGGLILASVLAPVTYFSVKFIVDRARSLRAQRRS
jgi:uncharacterized protein (DUF2062 family)